MAPTLAVSSRALSFVGALAAAEVQGFRRPLAHSGRPGRLCRNRGSGQISAIAFWQSRQLCAAGSMAASDQAGYRRLAGAVAEHRRAIDCRGSWLVRWFVPRQFAGAGPYLPSLRVPTIAPVIASTTIQGSRWTDL